MSWNISRTHVELGKFFLLDWSSGIQFAVPCAGLGVWIGKYSQDAPWQVVWD